MNTRFLIDSVVRQTTVLIAQLATSAGIRAPLGHIANQVFMSLVHEFESQGLGRKVIADMFGLALRSYQQKVQRLSESETDSGQTLWQAVYAYLGEQAYVSRGEVLRRFASDDPTNVRGILNDLVQSGLVFRSGRGDATVYRVLSDEEMHKTTSELGHRSLMATAWVAIYRNPGISHEQLATLVGSNEVDLKQAVEQLQAEGRIQVVDASIPTYSSERCFLPLGDEAGWEGSVFDHFQAVVAAIVTKLRLGEHRALMSDRIGGSTFSFEMWPGHPLEEEVYALLGDARAHVQELWQRFTAIPPSGATRSVKVTFYVGQSVVAEDGSTEENEL